MGGLAGILAVQIGAVHHRMPDRGGQWGIPVLAIGLGFLYYGILLMVRSRLWRAAASSTRGRVIDHVSRVGRGGRTTARPVVQFEAEGRIVMFRGQMAGRPGTWPLGQTVDVLYDRSDPRRAGLADAGLALSWWLIMGIGVLGAFFAIISG
jgi:Protein of unknown function (DUF3592)